MTARTQGRLAIAAAAAGLVLLVAANAQMLVAAIRSQPGCVAVEGSAAPAKRAC